MSKLRQSTKSIDPRIVYWCQGCECAHAIRIQTDAYVAHPCWTWDGNEEAPTFSPSILVTVDFPGGKEICHTFIKAGMVEFLPDCTHKLAGQTLPLPDWPYAEGAYGGITRIVMP